PGTPVLVVPKLEELGYADLPADALGLETVTWVDGQDPHALVGRLLGRGGAKPARLAIADTMPALPALPPRAALAGAEQRLAGADFEAAIVAEGHTEADFVIVGSGPNGASPHHALSDRVIEKGDVVVVDIGGPIPGGYNSDCTRTYAVGEPAQEDVRDTYAVLRDAQQAAFEAVRPGVTAEAVDAAAREPIAEAGFGEFFFHRTGHGIGLDVHEDPYIVAGNRTVLEPGMAFSIEPGIYQEGRWGARIEDIVIVTEDGAERVNNQPRDLVVLPA